MADKTLLRLSAGALLLSQKHAEKAIREAANRHIAEANAELAKQRTDRRAALTLVLLALGSRMTESLTAAILSGRQEARKASARRLVAELQAAGIQPTSSVRPMFAAASLARGQEDAAMASLAASSLVTQWRGLALSAGTLAGRRGKPLAAGLAKSKDLLAPRITRTAATETAHAYNDEHRALIREAVRYGDIDADAVMREWSALVDACEHCWPMHGERVGIDESFSGGYEPGDVHVNCMCTEVIVSVATESRKVA